MEKKYRSIMSIATILMAILILLLVQKNRELRNSLLIDNSSSSSIEQVGAGDYIHEFVGIHETGKELLSFAGQPIPSLIIIFSATCTPCEASFDNIIDFNNTAENRQHRIINVVLGDRTYVDQIIKFQNRKFKLYSVNEESFDTKYKIAVLPKVLYVDEKGRVERVWFDVIDQEKAQEIIDFIEKS